MEIIPFNGRFTIESPKGGHKTFQIKTPKKGKLKDTRILSLFCGKENTNDRQYQGFAFVNPTKIHVWQRFRGTDSEPSDHTVYAAMLSSMVQHGEQSFYYKKGYRLLIEKRCRVCNRVLTNPTSIREGIGPECAGRNTRVMEGERCE